MSIKAYSFEQNSIAYADIKRSVAEALTDSAIYFESFCDPKAMFTDISEYIETTDIILMGIETKVYLKFKPILIKAFNLTPAYSEAITKAIGDKISDEKTLKAHTLVPNECTELISDDGLFSGFYINDGDQYIIVFPLEAGIVPGILQKSGLPFFRPLEDKTAIFEEISDKTRASSKATVVVNKLKKNNIRIAIPSTPAAKMLKEDVRACEDYGEYVFFTPFVNDSGIEDPKEYTAQLAKGAMELRSAEIGATVSNIFREKSGDEVVSYYAFISVATADKIVVKKLFADSGESVDNLIIEATTELYSMINKYLDEVIFKLAASPDEIAKYEQSRIEAEVVADITPAKKKKKKSSKVIVILLAILLSLIGLAGAIFGILYFGGYFTKPSDAPETEVYQQNGRPTETEDANQYNPNHTVAELTEIASVTSIFDVTTTLPQVQPNTDYNIIYPNNNNNNNTTTKAEPSTEPSTKKPEPSTTEPQTEEPTDNDNELIWE